MLWAQEYVPEIIEIQDQLGSVYRNVSEFDFFANDPAYSYEGYAKVNGLVYHIFVFRH